jgi:hypothetical protein
MQFFNQLFLENLKTQATDANGACVIEQNIWDQLLTFEQNQEAEIIQFLTVLGKSSRPADQALFYALLRECEKSASPVAIKNYVNDALLRVYRSYEAKLDSLCGAAVICAPLIVGCSVLDYLTYLAGIQVIAPICCGSLCDDKPGTKNDSLDAFLQKKRSFFPNNEPVLCINDVWWDRNVGRLAAIRGELKIAIKTLEDRIAQSSEKTPLITAQP